MNIENKLINGTLYVGISGELDESAAVFTRAKIDKLTDSPTVKRVVLDMSEITFMDSTGIGVLIGRYKRLKSKNVPVFIANPSKSVDKLCVMSGLYGIMPKIC